MAIPVAESGEEMANARQLPLELVAINPQQARRHFDETALDELRQSIEEYGVLQPIGVRPVDGHYEILYGERRYRATVQAGYSFIPAIIYPDLDPADAPLLTALENLQREDLSYVDEAHQYERLLAAFNCSQHELARRLGIDHNRIARLVKLAREAPALLVALDAGRITLRGALDVLSHGETDVPDPGPGETSRAARPQAGRHEIADPGVRYHVSTRLKPIIRFEYYLQHLEISRVPREDRAALAERLGAAIAVAQDRLQELKGGTLA